MHTGFQQHACKQYEISYIICQALFTFVSVNPQGILIATAQSQPSQKPAQAPAQKPGPVENEACFVDSYLLYLLAAASEKASAQFHARVRSAGLRIPEWRVLAILVDRDGAMITRLADMALIEQSRLTRIIDQMDTRGLVRRESDKTDGRRVRVYLRAKGKRLAAGLVKDARQHEQGLIATLAVPDAQKLKPMLSGLLMQLEKSD